MNEVIEVYQYPIKPNELYHYGTPRHSGRYPYGSGKRPFQSNEKHLGVSLFRDATKKNLDKFGTDKDHNILYISGISGSGKSTLALMFKNNDTEIIHLDSYFERKNINEARKNRNKSFDKFLKANGFDISKLEDDVLFSKNIKEYFKNVDEFSKLSEKFGELNFGKKKVIMEGVQIGDETLYQDRSFYNNKPTIHLNTNSDISKQRAKDRDDKNKISRDKLLSNASETLNSETLAKYKNQYNTLNRIRISGNTKGKIFTKSGKVVAIVNTEKKDDGKIWIQGLEVFGKNKGSGLSRGLLDVAVNDLGATHLSVRNTNKQAFELYEKYGFRTYKNDGYMTMMSINAIKNIKHSESEVNFKMSGIYYLSHGGPGSGRYPLGSGDRPYQSSEGSGGRRTGGILGYIRQRKLKKEAEKERLRREEEGRKTLEAEKEKKKFEEHKEYYLTKASAGEVSSQFGKFTNQELQTISNRLNLEKQIKEYSQGDVKTSLDRLKTLNAYTDVGKNLIKNGSLLWNGIASVYNSTEAGKKDPLMIINMPEGKKKK